MNESQHRRELDNLKRSWMLSTVALTVGLSGFLIGAVPVNKVNATTLGDLERKKSTLQNERSGLNESISEAEREINRLQTEQDKINNEIRRLDMSITDTNHKIREKQHEITSVKEDIKKLNEEIAVLMKRIEKRNEVLKGRALSFQESGGLINYLDVLLGAQSFSDFIDRVTSVATIMEADQSILSQHRQDKQTLEVKQEKVEKELSTLEKMLTELEVMEKTLNGQKNEKDKLMTSLKAEEKNVSEAKFTLEEEERILAAQQRAIQQSISAEKKRIAEEEARRQQEENNNGGGAVAAPPVSNGTFTNPATGRLSSGFGSRWGTTHFGIDIANSAQTVPVVAAASGVVFSSYYSTSYGHVIFITHNINGQTYTTVYAHLDSRHAQVGDTVSKGQFIGYMGNTGNSFGKHLHFEVHIGEWNPAKSNAVDPLKYVNY